MGAMEKKRLLPALMAAVIAVSWATVPYAQGPALLQGIRTKPEEAELARTKNFLGNLPEPDVAEAGKALSGMKNSCPGEKQAGEAMNILSIRSPGAAVLPEKTPGSGKEKPALFYFFSFSMPRPSLREAAGESAAAGAVMVLRGLSGRNLRETARRISDVIGKTGARVWIDPLLFECFSVGAVPQLVLAYGHAEGAECDGLRRVKVSGDLSLPYALGLMEKEDPSAGMFIRRLRKSGFYRD